MIADLGSTKGAIYDDSSSKLTVSQNKLLMRIFHTPEKYLSHSEINTTKLYIPGVYSCIVVKR